MAAPLAFEWGIFFAPICPATSQETNFGSADRTVAVGQPKNAILVVNFDAQLCQFVILTRGGAALHPSNPERLRVVLGVSWTGITSSGSHVYAGPLGVRFAASLATWELASLTRRNTMSISGQY